MKEYILEIWLEGNCLHAESVDCESEEEAWEEMDWISADYFISGNYSKQGYTMDDFQLIVTEA